MNKLMQGVEKFWKDEEGAEVVEWVLVCALIVAAFVAGYVALGPAISDAYADIVAGFEHDGTAGAE